MRAECVRASSEGTHHSCSTPGPWDRHSSFGVLGACHHCRVGTGQAELRVSLPALCSCPADCQHCQLLNNVNPLWVLQEQDLFVQIPIQSTSIQIPGGGKSALSVRGQALPEHDLPQHLGSSGNPATRSGVELVRATRDKIHPRQPHSIFFSWVCALSCNSVISIP